VKKHEEQQRAALRARARSAAFEQKICRYERRRWPRLGVVGLGCGFDPRKPGFLSAARCRAPLVCPGVRRAHGASAIFMTASRSGGDHFGVLRTFMTRASGHERHSLRVNTGVAWPWFPAKRSAVYPTPPTLSTPLPLPGPRSPKQRRRRSRCGTWCERARHLPAPLGPHRDGATMNHGTSQPAH